MRYFHCPTRFRGKPYGCGFGPVNATVAMLDNWGICPQCKRDMGISRRLKPYRPPVSPRAFPVSASVCKVVSLVDGTHYCSQPVVSGAYCARHSYLNVTAREGA